MYNINVYISNRTSFFLNIIGPFHELNAKEIKEMVDDMWKNLYKLARTLQDYPGSKRVAEIVRGKVDNFKKYLPVLETICNPGIHDRHWAEVIKLIFY